VRLAHEVGDADEPSNEYDAAFYRERLVRAAESVLSPVGWEHEAIETYLADTRETNLSRFAVERRPG